MPDTVGIAREQWCYPEKIEDGMKPYPDYLKRTGYRLPTEAEWEYACRADARTSRYYGASEELSPRYGWSRENSGDRTWPVGQKRPNDLGLFDMHGNVYTWCQDRALYYPRSGTDAASDDIEDNNPISDSSSRVLRGASFVYHYALLRASVRLDIRPVSRGVTFVVRPARTYH